MASSPSVKDALGDLNKDSFVSLLSKLIGESKHVQNNPPELIPEEDRIVRHVLDVLLPHSTTTGGGPLIINHVAYHPNRGNLIVEYPGTEPHKILSFVGMHMDVVTANPSDWDFDPFSLGIDGDKLSGRGTTDCLGHVALVTELMKRLGETKPKLKSTVVAVFIASEENSSITGVGVDALVKDGLLNKLKNGPLFWIDTADKQPCIGTGGMLPWKLHVTGKLFHSGLAHKRPYSPCKSTTPPTPQTETERTHPTGSQIETRENQIGEGAQNLQSKETPTPPLEISSQKTPSMGVGSAAVVQNTANTTPLTLEQVRVLIQSEKKPLAFAPDADLCPPYPIAVVSMPYLEGYTVPKFIRFDGRKGNAKEHVIRFVDSLGVHSSDRNLRLR
ncbi:hypothetical protein RHGRI_030769 [Rhododendron griersonianum]|uniref:Acetylornithine deacetylase n=1 Tax=Rhododendron griersonianum TaxID=479676 RepID=A0AAV6I5D6_9ERIC|nr:hypothetical protein RHGRI_030769 [Rhododendron griersonianum]